MIETLPKFAFVSLPLVPNLSVEETCRFLHDANQDPPEWLRRSFYVCKTRILRTWGKRVCPDHIQRIASVCWNCNGRGVFWSQKCIRCGGSGYYRCRHVVLERWRLRASDTPEGYREFHVPTDVVAQRGSRVDIDGKMVHYRTQGTEESAMALLWAWRPSVFVQLCLQAGQHCESDSPLGDFARHLAWSRVKEEREQSDRRPSGDVPF